MSSHFPPAWRYRLLVAVRGNGRAENIRLLEAWARAEGGTASYNPLNTTEPWPGATEYNSAGVKNYPSGTAGIQATARTMLNGYYNGIVHDLRTPAGIPITAERIVERNAHEFNTWGTGAANILRVLATIPHPPPNV